MKDKKPNKTRNIKFTVYLSDDFVNAGLENLDLSERSIHCLRRAGFKTIGDVVENIERQDDLLKFRNLGAKSAQEIMNKIFLYHYEHLPESKRANYFDKLAKMNNLSKI